MSLPTFIEVVLPLALPKLYTYAVSFELADDVKIGQRVIVQFGKKKMYSAIVYRIHHQKPTDYAPKLIEEISGLNPIVTTKQLKLWDWMADYYMCTLGEVMNAALPSGLNLSSESVFLFNDIGEIDWNALSDGAAITAEALQNNGELRLEDMQMILNKKNVYPIIQELMQARLCVVKEELQKKYSPKKMAYIGLHQRFNSENALQALFEKLEPKQKQLEVLLHFLQLSSDRKSILKKDLLKSEKISPSSLKTLVKNEIFVEQKQTVSRLMSKDLDVSSLENLSEAQRNAYKEINEHFYPEGEDSKGKNTVALEGLTGSGKTHIYVKLIKDEIAKGNTVLYLLPEIALTAQIVMRLIKYFGDRVGVYHSKFNENERVEIYNKVLNKEYDVILSARSGVFLPFNKLGLIIVDEEHERSYKQFEPAPRYNARDTSIVMAHLYAAKVLLGSATISLETRRNIDLAKYAHVTLTERFGNAVLPEIKLLDTIDLRNRKKMNGLFSDPLKEAIKEALEKKEQVILFQNRRGFANYLNCLTCNWIPQCPNCDVSLTYHKYFNKLVCHYCGHNEKNPSNCRACGSTDMTVKGVGTEQIEEETMALFPGAKVGRLDLDTTRRKYGHEEIIFAFQNGELDILIGTQMVTKGLDFDNVSLVGIINVDQLTNFPDFRAGERAFQLIAQVSGRAGRKEKKGKVLVQTGSPDTPVLQFVKDYQFEHFYFSELLSRKQFNFPPYFNLIQITVKHKQGEVSRDASKLLADLLRKKLGRRVLGPTNPIIARVRNQYLKLILLKLEKDAKFIKDSKEFIKECINEAQLKFKTARFVVDVDP